MHRHKNSTSDKLITRTTPYWTHIFPGHRPPQACMFLMGGGSLAQSQAVANVIAEAVRTARSRQQTPGPLQVLHIPTAKTTRDKYDESIRLTAHIYTRYHGAQLKILHEFGQPPDPATAKHLLQQADLIHMPGGSTEYALAFWQKYDLLRPITQAVNRGAVVFGHSAGQIIWFEQALTDSNHYLCPPGVAWRYKMMAGIGEFRCLICPHAADFALQYTHNHIAYPAGARRRDVFLQYIYSSKRNGLAVDGNTAIQSIGRIAKVLGTGEVTLYKWDRKGEKLKITSLYAGQKFRWSTLEKN